MKQLNQLLGATQTRYWKHPVRFCDPSLYLSVTQYIFLKPFASNCALYPSLLMQVKRQSRDINSMRCRGVFLTVKPDKEVNGICIYILAFSFWSLALLMTFMCFLDEMSITCLLGNLLYHYRGTNILISGFLRSGISIEKSLPEAAHPTLFAVLSCASQNKDILLFFVV